MGGKQSKGGGGTAGSNATSTSSSSSAAPVRENTVLLNVYEPAQRTSPIGGVYHSGIVLYDTEYMFGAGTSSLAGITSHRPQQLTDEQWEYRETIRLGDTNKSRQEIRDIITDLKNSGDWRGDSYHLTRKNCNHFTAAVATALSMSVPSWVNRGAKIAGALGMGGSGVAAQGPVDLEGRPLRAEDTAALVHAAAPQDVCVDGLLQRDQVAVLGAKQQSCLDIIPVDAQGNFVKIKPSAVCQSDSDEQLLLFLPFAKPVALRSLLLRLSVKEPNTNPSRILLFCNRPNLDFSDVDGVSPTAVWELAAFARAPSKQEAKDGLYEAVLALAPAKWPAVAHLTVFVQANHGAPATKLHGLTLVGREK